MLASLLQSVGGRKQFFPGNTFAGQNVRHNRIPGRNGPGLVQGHDFGPASCLKSCCSFKKYTVLRPDPVSNHDGHRRSKAQSTGAGDDKDGNRTGEGRSERRPGDEPARERSERDSHDGRHKYRRNLVRNPGNWRFGRSCIGYHGDDLGQGRVFANPGGPCLDVAGLINRGGRNDVPFCLVHRNGLTRQGGFIDRCGAFDHDPVHRDGRSGLHDEDVPDGHIIYVDLNFDSIPDDDGRLRGKLQEALQGVGRAALRVGLQRLSDGDQGRNHGRGLEVHVFHGERIDRRHVAPAHRVRHQKEGDERIAESRRAAECHEGVHIRGSVKQPLVAVHEEIPIQE